MNENRFTGLANTYLKFRPAYPDTFIRYLYSEIGMTNESVIADIGAGTGIFTKLLLEKGSYVFAIEPNADMRSKLSAELQNHSRLTITNSSAENTTLINHSIDFVTCAQAFHWFDPQAFKKECIRMLKPFGKVILVWNIFDLQSTLIQEVQMLKEQYCTEFKGFAGGLKNGGSGNIEIFFNNGVCDYKVFRNDLFYNEEEFIGRNLSSSYAPKENDANYAPYINDLKKLYHKYELNGILSVPNITESYIGEV